MANPYSGNPSSVTVTYQFVVVAVVACGIFAAGVITIMYRRRRRAMMMAGYGLRHGQPQGLASGAHHNEWGLHAHDPSAAAGTHLGSGLGVGTRLVTDHRGVLVPIPGPAARKKRIELGPEPVVWDAAIGPSCAEDEYHYEKQGQVHDPDDGDEYDSDSDEVEKEKKGRYVAEWMPMSLAVPADATTACRQAPHLDATVLVAMPDRSLTFDPAFPSRYDPPPLPPSYGVAAADADVDVPGYIQLGVTGVPVEPMEWAQVEALVPPSTAPRGPSPPPGRRIRRVRVDGFGLLRL